MSEGNVEQPLNGDKARGEWQREPTLGERRVRLGFNPSGNAAVDRIKRIAADAIDLCAEMRQRATMLEPAEAGEMHRLLSLAQTAFEDAAMWAVKAATA